MKKFWRGLLWILGVLVVAITVFAVNLIWFRPWSLNLFYEKVFAELLFDDPELLSSIGLVEQFGVTGHNGKLTDASPAHQQKSFDLVRKSLAQLREYSATRQTESQRLSSQILDWFLERELEGEKYQFHDYPVNQLFGVQNELPSFMASTHRLQNDKDCDYYVQRLGLFPRKFEQLIEGLRLREQKQIVPPRFVVERVLKEMNAFVAQPPEQNILAASFKSRAERIAALTPARRSDLQTRVEAAIVGDVYPAYRTLIAYFEHLLPRTTTDDGVWKLPDGAAYYAYLLRKSTTTRLDPIQVNELGIREVARIENELRAVLDANGFVGVPIRTAIEQLAKDPKFEFTNDDAGRAAALAEYSRLITKATEDSRALFSLSPRAKIEVRRVPVFREKTSSGAYYEGGAMDGSRPGVFYANLRDMSSVPRWSMPTLAYHEGVPGHHWQISIARELRGLPEFRKMIPFTAFHEGWALYAEWLAYQSGWYEGDPFGNVGRLQAELFRAVRLVVDTGLHAKRWTRQQAIDYMREKTGMAESEVTAEVERYIVMPGQACAYKIGMLKLQELRQRAQTKLGAAFDQKEFHDVVLKNGAMPLEILEQQVDAYLAGKKM